MNSWENRTGKYIQIFETDRVLERRNRNQGIKTDECKTATFPLMENTLEHR